MPDHRLQIALDGLKTGVAIMAGAAGKTPEAYWELSTNDQTIIQARTLALGSGATTSPGQGQILSPFCGLKNHSVQVFLPLKRLAPHIQNDIFPSPQSSANPTGEIRTLWDGLDQAWKNFLATNPDETAKVEQLLALLQEYTWSVPSGTEGISVYDLARTTAALAVCLDGQIDDKKALLVSGDISGLQKFLYTLASDGAAKSLRARSVYLQWLAEAMTFSLLADLELSLCNVLYVGGGGFQLLVPPDKEELLKDLAPDLNLRLLKLHGGSLGITLTWEGLTEKDFTNFGAARGRLGEKLNLAKRRPFSAMNSEDLLRFFDEPATQGGDPLVFCRITGEDGDTVEPDMDGDYKSLFIQSLEELGRKLPEATHLVFTIGKKEEASRATQWHRALSTFGFYARLITNAQEPVSLSGGLLRRVWRLTPNQASILPHIGGPYITAYRPFAQLVAMNHAGDGPKTFDELAQPLQESGLKRWGVLRMDVDNLGDLFRQGYGSQVGIARTAGLSFALRLFFEGWLPNLAKGNPNAQLSIQKQDLSDFLYLQYSGGDDLFVVGAWEALPEFARRSRQSFAEFTAGNPHITLSAGIELFNEKYPLYQAARRAGEAEEAAKSYTRKLDANTEKSKDAITFLGQTLDWKEFEHVQMQAYQMARLVKAGVLSHGATQTVLSLAAQIRQDERRKHQEYVHNPVNQGKPFQKNQFTWFGRWTWLSAYQFTRIIRALRGREDEKKEAEDLLTKIRDSFRSPNRNTQLQTHGLVARWAQFLTRGEKQ